MTNPDRNVHSLAKTLARYPVSGRSWRLVFFGSGSDSPALEPYHDELGREEMRRLAQQVARINNRLQELDAAQMELFLQARDLYGRLADLTPKLARLEQQVSEIHCAQGSIPGTPSTSDAASPSEPTAAVANASPTAGDEWISVRDAARILDVAPSTIRRYIARGFLKSRRLPTGRGLRLLRSQVERLLIAQADTATPPPFPHRTDARSPPALVIIRRRPPLPSSKLGRGKGRAGVGMGEGRPRQPSLTLSSFLVLSG